MAQNFWVGDFSDPDWLLGHWHAVKKPGSHAGVAFGCENLQVIAASELGEGRKCLRVFYPAGSYSPSAPPPRIIGGSQFYGPVIPNGVASARLQYQIRFPPGFDWVKGGKLPGLYGGTGNTGKVHPNGADGFTTRCMWREHGRGIGYPFLPTSPGDGTTICLGKPLFAADGEWHSLTQEVTLNDPGENNGSIVFGYDDICVRAPDLKFRTVASLGIDGVLFQTFFGGGERSWATGVTTAVDFASFRVEW
jgi:hypothetical protein